MRSDRTLKAWYREINTRFFQSELPDNVCVKWADDDDFETERCDEGQYFGWANKADDGYHKYYIVMDRSKNTAISERLATLAHEMIHVATGIRDNHGPAFDRWHKILTERGLFKNGALVRGVTLF